VQRELNARQQAGSFAQRFGEEAARGKFGDSITDRALRDLQDVNTQSLTVLRDMQERLANYFKK
jgi:hypothetical protein